MAIQPHKAFVHSTCPVQTRRFDLKLNDAFSVKSDAAQFTNRNTDTQRIHSRQKWKFCNVKQDADYACRKRIQGKFVFGVSRCEEYQVCCLDSNAKVGLYKKHEREESRVDRVLYKDGFYAGGKPSKDLRRCRNLRSDGCVSGSTRCSMIF